MDLTTLEVSDFVVREHLERRHSSPLSRSSQPEGISPRPEVSNFGERERLERRHSPPPTWSSQPQRHPVLEVMQLQNLLAEQEERHTAVLHAVRAECDKERRELVAAREHDREEAKAERKEDRDEAKAERQRDHDEAQRDRDEAQRIRDEAQRNRDEAKEDRKHRRK
ncbi:hypothetical protein FIBSPDRAFT_859060 [Athelia psychrophila]|nr:hypothetical protein FIBSPDRAFT_859060 [Fibularhizoctonia sp. CBS 109695]